MPQTIPETERAEPGRLDGERAGLDAWLDYYRATMLHKCAGLTPEQLVVRSCAPSPLSLAGLIRHLTEMERAYAHRLADRELALLYCTDDDPDGDIESVSAAAALDDLRIFSEHCARSREVMGARELDDTFGAKHPYSLRWVYLYLIKEYARHAGHADLLRERIDGATGE
jgi:hypothetical protein